MHHWLKFGKIEFIQRSAVDAQGTKLNNLKFIAAVLMFVKTLKAALGNEKKCWRVITKFINRGNYQYDLNGDGQSTGKFKLHAKP